VAKLYDSGKGVALYHATRCEVTGCLHNAVRDVQCWLYNGRTRMLLELFNSRCEEHYVPGNTAVSQNYAHVVALLALGWRPPPGSPGFGIDPDSDPARAVVFDLLVQAAGPPDNT
jgi:hypothetical protein